MLNFYCSQNKRSIVLKTKDLLYMLLSVMLIKTRGYPVIKSDEFVFQPEGIKRRRSGTIPLPTVIDNH